MSAIIFSEHRSRWLSVVASSVLITSLLTIVIIVQNSSQPTADKISIREVKLAVLPPPPPPPKQITKPQQHSPKISLNHSGTGATIELGKLHLSDNMDIAEIAPPPLSMSEASLLHNSLELSWDEVFSLNDLDERPRLLSKLDIHYPSTLSQRGIHSVQAKVEVVIDTDGQVILKNILHCPHKEMNAIIAHVVKQARFTTPQKDGLPVRASFRWPLEFSDT